MMGTLMAALLAWAGGCQPEPARVSAPVAAGPATFPATIRATGETPRPVAPELLARLRSADYRALDEHARRAPPAATRSLDALAAYLVRPARNDAEKARAIYAWLTHHIAYDTDAFFSGRFRNASTGPEDVLRSRQSVCDGYAGLFVALAQRAGLEAVKVTGYAKGFSYRLGEPIAGEADHAWNAVRIEGSWALLDPTWGAGFVSGEQHAFVRRDEEHYFLTPPEQFLAAHLPEQSRWQLVARPVSLADYGRRALLKPAFFRDGLALEGEPQAVIRADERVALQIRKPAGVGLSALVLRGKDKLERELAFVHPGRGAVQAVFPAPGTYTLRIFSRPGGSEGGYDWAADFRVEVRRGTAYRFPRLGKAYFRDGLGALRPESGVLTAEGRVSVTVEVPAGIRVMAKLSQGRRNLEAPLVLVQTANGRARVDAILPAAEEYTLSLFSKPESSKDNFDHAVSYRVRNARAAAPGSRFPESYSLFLFRGGSLEAPLEGVLRANRRQTFRVGLPGAEEVWVVNGAERTRLERKGDTFAGEVMVRPGKCTVYVKMPGSARLEGLLGYEAR
jgi:hypothetical protein